jgi:hypothetical protein
MVERSELTHPWPSIAESNTVTGGAAWFFRVSRLFEGGRGLVQHVDQILRGRHKRRIIVNDL